jgi:hypothetical protein
MMQYWRTFQVFKIASTPLRALLVGVDDFFRILSKGTK